MIKKIIETAKENIVLIDPYVDYASLDMFKTKNTTVSLAIITSSKNRLTKAEIELFKEQYNNLEITIDERYHDRYLIIDLANFYHLGTSINYLGKRLSQITLIKDEDIIEIIKKRIN